MAADTPHPQVALLSSGNYSVMITGAATGVSTWRGRDVTRWREDATRDCWGQFVYVRDLEDGRIWSIGQQPLPQVIDEYHTAFHQELSELSVTAAVEHDRGGWGVPARRDSVAPVHKGRGFADRAHGSFGDPLDAGRLAAYTCNMSAKKTPPASVPCLCGALRQASRAVSRLYDEELRGVGLRTTQLSLLQLLRRSGEVRQRDLAGLTMHDETSLTRGLRPLVHAGYVDVRAGEDRREKWFRITADGLAKLAEARPAWERAQARIKALLPERTWRGLMEILPEVTRLTAGS
jgi:DNA-binding MarR family transcriptional regulator